MIISTSLLPLLNKNPMVYSGSFTPCAFCEHTEACVYARIHKTH